MADAGILQRCVLTGAPGTGKTVLAAAIAHIGVIVGEPARELIAEHREATGEQSLDGSPGLLVERLVARSIEKYDAAPQEGIVIYDRGLPDCVAYARAYGVDPTAPLAAAAERRYNGPVFIAPPWEEIYSVDDMRRATFEQVTAFHDELVTAYHDLGYDLVHLPKAPVAERAQLVRSLLESTHS